jgi:hypothetical protein
VVPKACYKSALDRRRDDRRQEGFSQAQGIQALAALRIALKTHYERYLNNSDLDHKAKATT